jgi:predicted PurR-regulated permease PerM
VTNGGDDPRALIRYAFACAAVSVMLMWAAYLAREILLLVYVAALVATGLSPLVSAVERREMAVIKTRVPRWLAILTIYLVVLGALVGIGMMIVPPLAEQAREFWNAAPELLHRGQQWLIDRGLLSRELTVREAVEKAPGRGDVVTTVLGAVWGFVGGLAGVLTILILAFYFLVDAETIVNNFVRLFPPRRRRRVNDVCRRVTAKVSAWLGGQLLLAAIIGTSAATALWLMGVPYFYVLALIAAVGEMIPIVGPLLSAIPAIAVAVSVSPTLALGVLIFFIVQQQLENHILVPKVMERQVGVSASGVVVALLLGGSLLGILGAILAVPTAAIIHTLLLEFGSEVSGS